jgi:hypothetical protein
LKDSECVFTRTKDCAEQVSQHQQSHLSQMMMGLEALKVVLRDLRGALLVGATLGKRMLTLEKVRECSLRVEAGSTMQVLMIWIDS